MTFEDLMAQLKGRRGRGEGGGVLTYEIYVEVGNDQMVVVQFQATPAAKSALDDLYALVLNYGVQARAHEASQAQLTLQDAEEGDMPREVKPRGH